MHLINDDDNVCVCSNCREEHFYKCDICEKWHSKKGVHKNLTVDGEEDQIICNTCYKELETCADCGEYFTELEESGLCYDCNRIKKEKELEKEELNL